MTENHDYTQPSEGTTDWHLPLNDNFSRIDTDVEIRDEEANLNDYNAKDGAKFLSTDTGTIYLGDGTNWIEKWTLDSGSDNTSAIHGRASLSENYSLSSGSTDYIPFDTADFGSNNTFDSSEHEFTVPESGVYLVTGVARFLNINDGTRIVYRATINKSYSGALSAESHSGTTDNIRVVVSGLVKLSAGDTIGAVAYQNGGSTADISDTGTFLGYVRVDEAVGSGRGDGGGATSADLINSPNLNVGYSELADGAALQHPVSVADGETITVYAWGVRDTDGNTPTGLDVELRDGSGSIVCSENTSWSLDKNGITGASWENTTGDRVDAVLAISNNTGNDYADSDGVGGQFGYEVS